jgi:hypothetical protein
MKPFPAKFQFVYKGSISEEDALELMYKDGALTGDRSAIHVLKYKSSDESTSMIFKADDISLVNSAIGLFDPDFKYSIYLLLEVDEDEAKRDEEEFERRKETEELLNKVFEGCSDPYEYDPDGLIDKVYNERSHGVYGLPEDVENAKIYGCNDLMVIHKVLGEEPSMEFFGDDSLAHVVAIVVPFTGSKACLSLIKETFVRLFKDTYHDDPIELEVAKEFDYMVAKYALRETFVDGTGGNKLDYIFNYLLSVINLDKYAILNAFRTNDCFLDSIGMYTRK